MKETLFTRHNQTVDHHLSMTRKAIWRDDNGPLCHSSAPALQALELLQKENEADWLFKLSRPWNRFVVLSTHSLDSCLWGESDHPAFGPPASLSLNLASISITPAGSVHKSRGDSVVRMWVQLKRWCVSCVSVLHRGHSGDGCDLASTLCKYDLRKEICLFWVGQGCDA